MFYRIFQILTWLPLRIFAPTRVIGKKNLPKKSRLILACNHQTNMDVVLLVSYIWHKQNTLAKHTLFKNRLSSFILKELGGIPVNRQNVDLSTIKTVIKLLNNNAWITIFPQGTRMETMDANNDIKNGLAMFALKTKSPIVPIWFANKPGWFKVNKILIGEPFELKEFYDKKPTKEVLDEASSTITQKMLALCDDYENKKKITKQT